MEGNSYSMRIAVIGDEDTTTLLKLAGVVKCYNNREDFDSIVNDEEIAILLITHEFARDLKEKIIRHRLLKNKPIIVEIPSKKKIEGVDTIKRLVVRAVGVEIEG